MRIHFLQHVPFEGPGIIEDWANLYGHNLTFTRFFNKENLPGISEFDWLIIMGGPMNVNEDDIYPWLAEEKTFIKQTIDSGKTVIGICLGAQLIATVLGANIFKNKEKEIGWFTVNKVKTEEASIFSDLPEQFFAFHWHGETFDLPNGAVHLAFSNACTNQAFLYKNNVIGLQFHFEMNEKSIRTIIENCKDELVPGKFVQDENEILVLSKDKIKDANIFMRKIFQHLLVK